jgi:hypothetical protein
MLWKDLPHPSSTQAGPTARYRRHDGGGNNPHNPEMGKAGSPYSRNVPPMKPKGKYFATAWSPNTDDLAQGLIYQTSRTCTKHF